MAATNLGMLELTVLLAVARLSGEAYGLAIRRDLAARTGRDYSVGAIYTTLDRLEAKGFVRSRRTAPVAKRGGRSRREFEVTGAGARAIRRAERTARGVWAGVGNVVNPETP